ncbi:flagellar basal body P-ring formation chaperone FlgA [Parasedimentitalea psychrophila]|uniref:Flagella basal body P-ring formation protein FlgA n=1 Tax=Parasedimentitalea psychrophila TaxID=2997337 RepID=A0A9Y2L3K1_9RHOB|nr:flagellar basal body P-ring formation chaperone FlgA [Parasedimentitalea psychrophila]WIY26752.1 flagellar basal body P-ring formation chaperone FlgA [Parasedimentitalea psychrophila]
MKLVLTFLMVLMAQSSWADTLVPVRTIRAKQIIYAEDLAYKSVEIAGAFSDPVDVVGQEARVSLYAGRPIRPGDIGPPAIVERNDLIMLRFRRGSLLILTEGRSLGRGSEGDIIRAMNLASRTTISGRISADGSIEVR